MFCRFLGHSEKPLDAKNPTSFVALATRTPSLPTLKKTLYLVGICAASISLYHRRRIHAETWGRASNMQRDPNWRRHGGERATRRETLIGILLFLNRRMAGWMKCSSNLNRRMMRWTKCPSDLNRWMTGWMKCPSGWMTDGFRGSFCLPLLYVIP